MNLARHAIGVVAVMSALAGCAATPAPHSAPTTATAAAVSQTPAAQALPATNGDVSPAAQDAAATIKAARALGYKPRQLNGATTIYCRTETSLGTHIGHSSCLTQEQLAAAVQHTIGAQGDLEKLQRISLAEPANN